MKGKLRDIFASQITRFSLKRTQSFSRFLSKLDKFMNKLMLSDIASDLLDIKYILSAFANKLDIKYLKKQVSQSPVRELSQ